MHKRFHGFPSEKDADFFPRRLPQALDCPPADAGLSEKDADFFPRRLPQALDCPPADAGLFVGKLPFTVL